MVKYIKTQKKSFKKGTKSRLFKRFLNSIGGQTRLPACAGLPHIKLSVVAGLMVLLFVGLYVFLITENSIKNYKIRDLQASIEEMQKQNRQLEVSSAGSQSATTINSQVEILGMTAIDKVDYINVVDKTVARR